MAGVDIQARVAAGLARANTKVGSGDKVFLIKTTTTPGNPIDPGITTKERVELKNALFSGVNVTQFSNALIQSGDREMICDASVVLQQSDLIEQGDRKMIVVLVNPTEPMGVLLVQSVVVRDQ